MQHFPCQEQAPPPVRRHYRVTSVTLAPGGQEGGPATAAEADGRLGRPLDATGRKRDRTTNPEMSPPPPAGGLRAPGPTRPLQGPHAASGTRGPPPPPQGTASPTQGHRSNNDERSSPVLRPGCPESTATSSLVEKFADMLVAATDRPAACASRSPGACPSGCLRSQLPPVAGRPGSKVAWHMWLSGGSALPAAGCLGSSVAGGWRSGPAGRKPPGGVGRRRVCGWGRGGVSGGGGR